jgi:hypothetical protein
LSPLGGYLKLGLIIHHPPLFAQEQLYYLDTSVDIRKRKWEDKGNMPTETNNESSPSINKFVRAGRESAQMPGRPESVVQAYEAAFKIPIDQIDAMVLGRTASQDIIDGPTPEAAPASTPLSRLGEVFRKGRAKLNEFGDATGINRLLAEDRGEINTRTINIIGGVAVVGLIAWAGGSALTNMAHDQQRVDQLRADDVAEEAQLTAIETAATTYNEDETFVGSFTIGPENPTISQGVDNVVNSVNPNVDPANVGFSATTARESGIDQGVYHPGETYDVVLEDVNGDGQKEVIVQDGDLNPN